MARGRGISNLPLFGFIAGETLVNSGGTTVSVCGPNDNTTYCSIVRGFNIFKMILFIIFILALISYCLYYFTPFFKSFTRVVRKSVSGK